MVRVFQGPNEGGLLLLIAGPAVQCEATGFIGWAGDDEDRLMWRGVFHGPDAQAVQVPKEWSLEERRGGGFDEGGGVFQGHDQGTRPVQPGMYGTGVSKTDVERPAVGAEGQGFDIDALSLGGELFSFFPGEEVVIGEAGGLGQVKFVGPRLLQDGLQKPATGATGRLNAPLGPVQPDLRGKEAVAAGAQVAVFVAAVGADPVNPISRASGSFQVRLGVFGVHGQEGGEVIGRHGRRRCVQAVNAEDVGFVVSGDEFVVGEGHGGRGVAHLAEVQGRGRLGSSGPVLG